MSDEKQYITLTGKVYYAKLPPRPPRYDEEYEKSYHSMVLAFPSKTHSSVQKLEEVGLGSKIREPNENIPEYHIEIRRNAGLTDREGNEDTSWVEGPNRKPIQVSIANGSLAKVRAVVGVSHKKTYIRLAKVFVYDLIPYESEDDLYDINEEDDLQTFEAETKPATKNEKSTKKPTAVSSDDIDDEMPF
jgi:hypothetical protein